MRKSLTFDKKGTHFRQSQEIRVSLEPPFSGGRKERTSLGSLGPLLNYLNMGIRYPQFRIIKRRKADKLKRKEAGKAGDEI